MRWETAKQQKQVHVIHNQHIIISRNSLVTQRRLLDKEKHYNETYKTITKILQNGKKLTDEMNLRFRTTKPLEKNTFVLVTNQQHVDGVSKKLLPLKTGPYLIIDKLTETTYILKDSNKEHITIHRNHIVSYYPKEKHIKLELQKYLLTNEVTTLN